jgi:hypothetical protein
MVVRGQPAVSAYAIIRQLRVLERPPALTLLGRDRHA